MNNAPPTKVPYAAANAPKPLASLIQTLALLVALLVAAALGIGFFKHSYDRRLITGLVEQQVAEARRLVEKRQYAEGEEILVHLVDFAPESRERVGRDFLDWMVIMPRLEARLCTARGKLESAPDRRAQILTFQIEMLLRAGQPDAVLSRLIGAGALADKLPREAYQRFAAIECQAFDKLPPASEEGAGLIGVPGSSLLFGASPLRGLRQGIEPPTDYHEGVVAFYQGHWDLAEGKLMAGWDDENTRADATYLLGALDEIRGKKDEACAWYARALTANANHLRAATAYVRAKGR